MKATIKTYIGNIRMYNDDFSYSFCYDDFQDQDGVKMKATQTSEYISDLLYCKFGIEDNELVEQIVDTLLSNLYIISDDEVYMYKVNTYEAYRADEKGIRWMTHCPEDTIDYKHELIERTTKYLPKGFWYDEDNDQFVKNDTIYELVNENDDSVSLVSSEGIVKWF